MANALEIKEWTIYKITNPLGQIYIGRTINFKGRLSNYKTLSKSIIRQRRIYKSFETYGFSKHLVEILEVFTSNKDFADDKEMFWIRSHMSNYIKWPDWNGLNMNDGGTGTNGGTLSQEARRKIGDATRIRPVSAEQRQRMSVYFKANPTLSMLGKHHTPETKEKMSLAKKGKPSPHKGKKFSDELRAKYSEIQRKRIGKPIIQYNLGGEFIAEYGSIVEASEKIGLSSWTILQMLRSTYPYMPRYIFKYK